MKGEDSGEMGGWELSARKELLRTPVVRVMSGPVVCRRSGRTKDFIELDFPDWVNVVAVTPDNRIVLIKQFRYGSRRQEIEIPGGMIDPGEDPVTAGCRELMEETGYSGEEAEIIGRVCPNPAIQGNSCYTVLVRRAVKTGTQSMDEMEDIYCFLEPEAEVFRRIGDGSIDHGLVLNGLMYYQLWRRENS